MSTNHPSSTTSSDATTTSEKCHATTDPIDHEPDTAQIGPDDREVDRVTTSERRLQAEVRQPGQQGEPVEDERDAVVGACVALNRERVRPGCGRSGHRRRCRGGDGQVRQVDAGREIATEIAQHGVPVHPVLDHRLHDAELCGIRGLSVLDRLRTRRLGDKTSLRRRQLALLVADDRALVEVEAGRRPAQRRSPPCRRSGRIRRAERSLPARRPAVARRARIQEEG